MGEDFVRRPTGPGQDVAGRGRFQDAVTELIPVINGTVAGKLANLQQVLIELRSLGLVTEQALEQDWMMRRAVERDLQIAVEIVVDVCHRLVALAGLSAPASSREAIELCHTLGALSKVEPYRRMVGFRNLVHRYEFVDLAVLADVVNNQLEDFDAFRREVEAYVAR